MPVPALQSYIVLTVDEVDLSKRIAHCLDKTNSHIQAAFRTTGAGIFYVPAQGQRWTAKKVGNVWHLEHRLDSPDDQTWVTTHMAPGDVRLEATNIFIGGALHFYGAAQAVGGAKTAGATYGATEQQMLQIVYNCLRNVGLLT